MDSVLRGLAVYAFLFVIVRLSGNRTLSQTTNFDLVLLLIISETTQQAMVDNDHSITNGFLLIITLVGTTVVLAALKQFFPKLDPILEGKPIIVVDNGHPCTEIMQRVRVNKEDILSAARMLHGLERMDEVKYAILERNGELSIVPFSKS